MPTKQKQREKPKEKLKENEPKRVKIPNQEKKLGPPSSGTQKGGQPSTNFQRPIINAADSLLIQNVPSGVFEYAKRMLELGVVLGKIGDVDINPHLNLITQALHQVMAGGEVEIKLIKSGLQAIVDELDDLMERGYNEANAINRAAGYRLAMEL